MIKRIELKMEIEEVDGSQKKIKLFGKEDFQMEIQQLVKLDKVLI